LEDGINIRQLIKYQQEGFQKPNQNIMM